MGKTQEPDRATEQMGIRVTPGERAAVEEMARRRFAETGDATTTGWYRAMIRREAKAAGIQVDATTKPRPNPKREEADRLVREMQADVARSGEPAPSKPAKKSPSRMVTRKAPAS